MTKCLRWLNRIGRRGAFLLFLAIIFVNGAVSFRGQDGNTLEKVYPLLVYVPPMIWAASWLFTALCCVVASWWSRVELWAFALSQLMFTLWAGNYAWAWIEHSPLRRPWSGMLLYLAFSGTIMLIAGWKENAPGIRKFHGRD